MKMNLNQKLKTSTWNFNFVNSWRIWNASNLRGLTNYFFREFSELKLSSPNPTKTNLFLFSFWFMGSEWLKGPCYLYNFLVLQTVLSPSVKIVIWRMHLKDRPIYQNISIFPIQHPWLSRHIHWRPQSHEH